ncbi:MAG: DUF4190 domain-containing protein [Clostridia bacterium]|nr:DUF4190 domain-containing protein [Clostridia bacterium]
MDNGWQNNNQQNNQNGDFIYKQIMEDKQKNRIWSVGSLVIGIFSVLCCCFEWPGLIFGVLAIVFAILSRKNLGYFDGLAIAGVILGIFGTVFSVFMIISGYFIESSDFYNEFITEFEKQYNDMNDPNSF